MNPTHPPFDTDDIDNIRVSIFLRNGHDFMDARPYEPTVGNGTVTFWWNNDSLRVIPLDLVKQVVFHSVKPAS